MIYISKTLNSLTPKYLFDIIPVSNDSCYNTRVQSKLELPQFHTRGGSRTAATSKMECFVIIVNNLQPLTIMTKRSILDVAAALDPPLHIRTKSFSNTLFPFWILKLEIYHPLPD